MESEFSIQENLVSPGEFRRSLSRGLFSLPIAFSSTLRTIIVADLVYRVKDDVKEAVSLEARSQLLPASGCQHTLKSHMLVQWSRDLKQQTTKRAPVYKTPHARRTIPGHECCKQYFRYFSHSGLYLAVLDGDSLGITNFWVLTIFEDLAPEPHKPSFDRISSIGLSFSPYILNSRRDRMVCFHSSEPIIAFCPQTKVVIWQFADQGRDL